ncbi:hypothetical protein OG301_38570 [Streptomyces platensis]|uniref:hypothetical protein n=1 Tax=Streptomyces platensis TaxID=58346 RepID=UPI002E13D644|nr:hypothetical protein OG229_38235 [Streptomyces platensis]WTI56756.1 hypothetical protein OG301_38570 [Streptomyces platensis]WUB84527.1 hypothetical protein OG424_38340 [Streptomyces platensis]
MRVQDIRIGETYQVKVPQRLPPALRTRYPRTRAEFAADMRLHQHRGDRFELTVTDIAPEAATVDGYEATTTNRVTLRLTAEQAELLELPAGPEYEIDGFITDAEGNEAILAATVTYAGLPAVWLRPLEEPVRIAPSTARFYRARVQAQATGMTAQDITRAAADAKEHQRDVAGQALDSYRAEQWLRIAEVQHQEWRRISALMADTTRKTYAPQSDPEAIAE